jgi:retron-type reverse transcriptase
MAHGFSTTTLVKYQIDPQLEANEKLAFIIDDYTLSHVLRTPCKTLWFAIISRKNLYDTFYIPKKTGGVRTIHAPHPYIKRLLYRLYKKVLNPLHRELSESVTGYREKRGTKAAVVRHVHPCAICDAMPYGVTAKGHACPRNGTYIKMDLKDFFHTTRKWWIERYLKSVGYSDYVSDLMAVLMTLPNLPHPTVDGFKITGVPQGSPTSGAICNLVAAQRLDPLIQKYLDEMNEYYGLEEDWKWKYSRYADDIAITCGRSVPPHAKRIITKKLAWLIQESGYFVNKKKTKVKYRKQRKRLLGLVFNDKANVSRKDYLTLRAIVYNCLTLGFTTQAMRAGYDSAGAFATNIRGKINYVKHIHPTRGEKLTAVFDAAVKEHTPWLAEVI